MHTNSSAIATWYDRCRVETFMGIPESEPTTDLHSNTRNFRRKAVKCVSILDSNIDTKMEPYIGGGGLKPAFVRSQGLAVYIQRVETLYRDFQRNVIRHTHRSPLTPILSEQIVR
jgi:hypothetical protein